MEVRQINDPRHPRSNRETLSNADVKKLLDEKVLAQNGVCGICNEMFTGYADIAPDPTNPCGMGGTLRDDHPDKIQAVNRRCNGERGSSRG